MNICVYSSSSNAISKQYFDVAISLGGLLVEKKHNLVYGGSNVGLMKALADTVGQGGQEVIGVMPKFIIDAGYGYKNANELIVVEDMYERKKIMASRADAFIALPGGFGTLEEILEVLSLLQLGVIDKPIVFINTNGFYDHLLNFFEVIYKENFARKEFKDRYFIAEDAKSAISNIESYKPSDVSLNKWL